MKNKKYLVFDIGGTFIKWGVVTSEFEIIENSKFAFDGQNLGYKPLIKEIGNLVKQIESKYDISGIGITIPGVVDPKTSKIAGEVLNIKDMGHKDIKKDVSKFSSKVVVIENDANAAALGESTDKKFKEYRNILMVTLGTGIGGGIILDQKLFHGNGMAGEIGRSIIEGRNWEQNFSAKGLTKLVNEMNRKELTTYEILESKDKEIVKTLEFWYRGIGIGIANLIFTLNFEAIIIGGGISESKLFDLKKIKKYIDECLIQPEFINSYKIFKASKGNNAALIGMAKMLNDVIFDDF